MPLDQRIRKLGAPLYRLFKKNGLSSSGKQSSIVRSNPQAGRVSNVHWRPFATPPPSLPVELWMKIIHELSHKEWMVLCRVCWLLCRIARPCLYEDIILHSWENLGRTIFDRGSGDPLQLKRTINQRRELGAYVRSLAFVLDDRPRPNNRGRYPLLFELHLFPNLERLHMLHVHFDLELCNILHSHPRLRSVTFTRCTLDESLVIRCLDQDLFPHSSISTVKVSYPKRSPLIHAWAALAPPKIESLTVQSTPSTSDAGLILTRFMELNKTSFLTTLSLDTFSPAVVRFLIASPQLRHLILDVWMDEDNLMSFSLPTDAIPFLEEYSGPAEISSTFIRGRPVHTVKFISPLPIREDRLVEILISLKYCSVPLTSLELSLSNATTGSWLSHVPVTVRCLTFDYLDWLDIEQWLPAISHLTSLQTLSGTFRWQAGKMLHRDEIMQISNTCQSLREIDIGRQRWRIGGQRVWKPVAVFMIDV